jgi:hypothetical protein
MAFLGALRQEWLAEASRKGLYDPKTRETMAFQVSYK